LLAKLARPLIWRRGGDEEVSVRYLVVCSYWFDQPIVPEATRVAINIAYMVDPSVLTDMQLDFAKCHYSAIGVADVTADDGGGPGTVEGFAQVLAELEERKSRRAG
jgi:hypothetical protein